MKTRVATSSVSLANSACRRASWVRTMRKANAWIMNWPPTQIAAITTWVDLKNVYQVMWSDLTRLVGELQRGLLRHFIREPAPGGTSDSAPVLVIQEHPSASRWRRPALANGA